jgi:hypothetical protein
MFATLFTRCSSRHQLSMRDKSKRLGLLTAIGFTLSMLLVMLAATSTAWSSPKVDGGAQQSPPPPPTRMPVPGDPRADRQVVRREPGSVTASNWTNLYPGLNVISAVSSTEAWAGGEYGHLVHYTGGSWVEVDPDNMRGSYISDIDMVSSSSGWLVTGYKAYQYDGSAWQERSQGMNDGSLIVNSISAISSNNVWGVGLIYDSTSGSRGTMVHWDGSNWFAAGPVLSSTTYLSDIEMVSATDGWAVGNDYGGQQTAPVLLRYNAGTWSPATMPPGVRSFLYVSAASPTDIWFTGYDTSYVDRLYRYNGSTWSIFALPDGSYTFDLSMLTSSEGWAITTAAIIRWNGTSWSIDHYLTDPYIYDISGVSGQVWAVGPADTIMSRPSSGRWVQERGGPTTNSLYSVSTLSTDDAWAVGENGVIAHYTGSSWQRVASPSINSLYDVQMLTPTDGYAVGYGTILKWDGASWTQVVTTSSGLRGVYMLGSGEGCGGERCYLERLRWSMGHCCQPHHAKPLRGGHGLCLPWLGSREWLSKSKLCLGFVGIYRRQLGRSQFKPACQRSKPA